MIRNLLAMCLATCAMLLAPFAWTGCKKEGTPLPVPVSLEVEHRVGALALGMDTIRYMNAAGNSFSVSRLLYYLSGLTFIDASGVRHALEGAWLVDAGDGASLLLSPGQVPRGRYTGLELHIGVVPGLNTFGRLPNTVENNAMFWPEQMGGGYHFLKLEGHFLDDQGQPAGYAMHIGTDAALVTVSLDRDFKVDLDDARLKLRMDLLEWFQTPETYDLNTGNYSMGDEALMQMISKNGSDVFTLYP